MGSKQLRQEQKLAILKSARQVGIKDAARRAEVHYTTVYQWQHQLEALGEEAFLAYKPSYPGRGIKKISPEKEEAVLSSWKRYPAFGPGQVRNQLRRQGISVSIKTIRGLMEANGYRRRSKRADKEDEERRFEARRPFRACPDGHFGIFHQQTQGLSADCSG